MRLASAFTCLVCGCLAAAPAQARTEVLKTGAGSLVHWSTSVITVGMDNATTPPTLDRLDVILAMDHALRAWNRIPADQPELRLAGAGGRDVTVSFCRGAWRGDTIDLGRTQFTASPIDGRVGSATVEINACDHEFTVSADSSVHQYDLQAVLAHELGHVLGLGHSDDHAAIMFPNGQGASRRLPAADDETALAVIYLGRDRGSAAPAPTATPLHAAPPSPAVSPSPSTAPIVEAAPADSVSSLNVKGTGGREMTVYTCEPTLLPPLSDAQSTAKPSARAHVKNRLGKP